MRILLLTLLSACALSHEPEDIVSSSASEPTSELFHCDAVFDGHTVQYSAQLNYSDGSVTAVAGVDGGLEARTYYPDQTGYDTAPIMVRVLHSLWTLDMHRYALPVLEVQPVVGAPVWTSDHCNHFWR